MKDKKTKKQQQSMHDKQYTQYRLRTEMHVGGIYARLNEEPTKSMFVQAWGE